MPALKTQIKNICADDTDKQKTENKSRPNQISGGLQK